MKQIQIPSGMRDILPDECEKKQAVNRKIMDIFTLWGYRPIETPLLEFYATYRSSFASLEEETLYKFVDDSGQILTLRTDMTLPIARVCASKYTGGNLPLRFSYCSNVYKVRQSFAGKRNEVTDCGIELIGPDEKDDPEVLSCALDVMRELFRDRCVLEIGNSRFFWKACRLAGLDEEQSAVLSDLIDRKAMTDTKQMIEAAQLRPEEKEFFNRLPLLGGENALEDAEAVCFDEALREIIRHLCRLKEQLEDLGYGRNISFDLGKVPHRDYYTGIIFEGFAEGIGSGVLSGGRYDTLLRKLGRDLPAVGFGVKSDLLIGHVETETQEIRKLYYRPSQEADAIRKARELRKYGPVELVMEETE